MRSASNDPERAARDGVLVIPTVVRAAQPELRLVGNLRDQQQLRASVDVRGAAP